MARSKARPSNSSPPATPVSCPPREAYTSLNTGSTCVSSTTITTSIIKSRIAGYSSALRTCRSMRLRVSQFRARELRAPSNRPDCSPMSTSPVTCSGNLLDSRIAPARDMPSARCSAISVKNVRDASSSVSSASKRSPSSTPMPAWSNSESSMQKKDSSSLDNFFICMYILPALYSKQQIKKSLHKGSVNPGFSMIPCSKTGLHFCRSVLPNYRSHFSLIRAAARTSIKILDRIV